MQISFIVTCLNVHVFMIHIGCIQIKQGTVTTTGIYITFYYTTYKDLCWLAACADTGLGYIIKEIFFNKICCTIRKST